MVVTTVVEVPAPRVYVRVVSEGDEALGDPVTTPAALDEATDAE